MQKQKGFPEGKSRRQASIDRNERTEEALRLHYDGVPYRKIGERLGVSYQSAFNMVKAELEEAKKKRDLLADLNVVQELKYTEDAIRAAHKDMFKSIEIDYEPNEDGKMTRVTKVIQRADPQMINAMLKAQERKSKFLALDKPVENKLEITHKTTEELILLSQRPELLEDPTLSEDVIDAEIVEDEE